MRMIGGFVGLEPLHSWRYLFGNNVSVDLINVTSYVLRGEFCTIIIFFAIGSVVEWFQKQRIFRRWLKHSMALCYLETTTNQ